MRVYIISTQENIPFAEKLLEDIKNVRIISHSIEEGIVANIDNSTMNIIKDSDVVLAIVDKKFIGNTMLYMELEWALIWGKKNRTPILIPIILDNAIVPTALEGMIHVKCDSKSEEDIRKTKLNIQKVLEHKRNYAHKHTKENHSRTSSMIIITLAIEMLAVLFVVLFIRYPFSDFRYFDMENIISLSLVLITVMMSVVTLFTSYLSIMKRRWQEDDKEEIESYSIRLKQAIVPEEIKKGEHEHSENEDKKNEIDALGRMLINLEDIKEFYTWSQKQAKASFVLAVSMCISGFALMIASIILPIAFRLSFQMSIIPAVGGVITELIAGTALVVYRNSLLQLNHYHKALHEDERFLSSVNLLGKFSTVEAQDDMLREIIRSEIQMNLVGLTENVDKKINIKTGKERTNSKEKDSK
ncbi:MAG: toll/interleukin-1 receptor domain-containing protein [Lachnospiraceae bacterium]|nr:toll/interleukin-1 receptor domain-containing protein [Lachnospiraceae bacterium]